MLPGQWMPLDAPTSGPAQVGVISGLGVLSGATYDVTRDQRMGCMKQLGVRIKRGCIRRRPLYQAKT